MRIYFRDEIGPIMVEVDEYGISFVEGVAIFASEGGDVFRVDAKNIEMIDTVEWRERE